jgi:hypothetical protein
MRLNAVASRLESTMLAAGALPLTPAYGLARCGSLQGNRRAWNSTLMLLDARQLHTAGATASTADIHPRPDDRAP